MPDKLIRPDDLAALALVESRENEHPPREVMETFVAELARLEPRAPDQPLDAKCSRRYTARRSSGRRPLEEIRWIVMHSTEGATAQGAAAWFANDDSRGSAHLCLDDRECYRTLANDRIPWGAPGANYGGFHIEQAGLARWPSYIWTTQHRRELSRGAYKAALHCRLFELPPYFVDAPGLLARRRGVTDHDECSKAFGGTHWDPGSGWPRRLFMTTLRYHYNRLGHVEPTG